MVEIISKSDGPRRQDAEVKRLIEQNRATITRIADHISGGSYSAGKARRQAPAQPSKRLIMHVDTSRAAVEAKPSIRVSLNGRVVAVDENSGRQLHHIGDIRRRDGVDTFVLATSANLYFSPVEDSIASALTDLDGTSVAADHGEDALAAEIGRRLGMT